MEARALADSVSGFCQERLGLIALELEANEADKDDVIAEADRVTELLEVARQTGEVDFVLVSDALQSSRRMDEHREGRAVFEAVKDFMLELHEFMYSKLNDR